jgi:hypothetical protein
MNGFALVLFLPDELLLTQSATLCYGFLVT